MKKGISASGLSPIQNLFSKYLDLPIVRTRNKGLFTLPHYAKGGSELIKESIELKKVITYFDTVDDTVVQFEPLNLNAPVVYHQSSGLEKRCYEGGESLAYHVKFDKGLTDMFKQEAESLKGPLADKMAKALKSDNEMGDNLFQELTSLSFIDHEVARVTRGFDTMIESRVLTKAFSSILPTRQGSGTLGAVLGTPTNPIILNGDSNSPNFWLHKLNYIAGFIEQQNIRMGVKDTFFTLPYQMLKMLAGQSNLMNRHLEFVFKDGKINKEISETMNGSTDGAYVLAGGNSTFIGLMGMRPVSGSPYGGDGVFECLFGNRDAIHYYSNLAYRYFDKPEDTAYHYNEGAPTLHFEGLFGADIPYPELLGKIYVKLQ